MNQLFNYFHAIRPLNVLLSGVSVLIASYILNITNNYMTIIIAIVVMLFCSSANIINDLFDITTDKISHPNRPIILLNNIQFNYNLVLLLIILLLSAIVLSYLYFHFYANLFLVLILPNSSSISRHFFIRLYGLSDVFIFKAILTNLGFFLFGQDKVS